MDDYILDRIDSEIKLCFSFCAKYEAIDKDTKNTLHYVAAAKLIEVYNALVNLYYSKETQTRLLKGSVEDEYRIHKQNN